MWLLRGQKWCKDNFVLPFLAILVLYYFKGGGVKLFVFIEMTIFPLYSIHIIVFIASEKRKNYRLLANSVLIVTFSVITFIQNLRSSTYSATIMRSVIISMVKNAKT